MLTPMSVRQYYASPSGSTDRSETLPIFLCVVLCKCEHINVRSYVSISRRLLTVSHPCMFSLSAGTVGPAFFNLGILDSLLVILVVDVM